MTIPDDDSLAADVLGQLDEEQREIVAELLEADVLPLGELRDEVSAYLIRIQRAAETVETVDVEMAEEIGEIARALLEYLGEVRDDEAHRVVNAAIQYFVLTDDADDDLESPIGFDDDAEVISAVAISLGLDELVID